MTALILSTKQLLWHVGQFESKVPNFLLLNSTNDLAFYASTHLKHNTETDRNAKGRKAFELY